MAAAAAAAARSGGRRAVDVCSNRLPASVRRSGFCCSRCWLLLMQLKTVGSVLLIHFFAARAAAPRPALCAPPGHRGRRRHTARPRSPSARTSPAPPTPLRRPRLNSFGGASNALPHAKVSALGTGRRPERRTTQSDGPSISDARTDRPTGQPKGEGEASGQHQVGCACRCA